MRSNDISAKTVITDGKGSEAKVRFSLTQWQEFIDDHIPSMKSAKGTIQFEDTAKAFYFFNSGGTALLSGGGIEALVLIITPTAFTVAGPIKDLDITK